MLCTVSSQNSEDCPDKNRYTVSPINNTGVL
jgi:hypothetical protein